jgi:Predicted acetyltransferase
MINNIDKSHPIFSGAAYQKDAVPFSLIELIKQGPSLLVSDEKSFIIGMSSPKFQAWIWTADDISKESLSELIDFYYDKFSAENSAYFVAKPEVASLLAKRFIAAKKAQMQCVHMESYECPILIPARNTSVVIERPSQNDLKQIASAIKCFTMECLRKDQSEEDNRNETENFIKNKKSFVIKQNGNVVAMACSVQETERYVAINHVFTCKECRGQGFASALVAYISRLILNDSKIPILYTDLSNPASNKAYKNVGFIERGKVDEIALEWGGSL